ncbi:hypothetical protein CCZ01_01465 [Helicobacter monodelphidis]|uniref:bifunctional phosphopantothenoylcysteine decarboxylase/phosphopantothenate--cysteine ligase CoaBC n=1 Tax=Helicobacter sp. 15-1451 TaxID=2004995 RepID=UPI000DCD8936|nr:bifunctional phosphopantothenoylcysteine decarboxylase/phosphopantothenate--cysteine ligase CoaBC [Helicobacter sp. 15-1451]RAX58891.1 hypothetical protein CCZ01_01465 [Helicobacter sp. 15-1451]
MQLLQGRRIILGVSASISIYKSLEILQLFKKLGAEIKVVMSNESKKFLTPLLFEALSHSQVLECDSESWEANKLNHISLAKWGEILLIAPASVNTINKLAAGIADNLLLQTAIAFKGQKVVAPAANTTMFLDTSTQESLQKLIQRNTHIISPICKELACQDTGIGALQEPYEIVLQTARMLLKEEFWENREVVITGGGSIECIDSVRYISNFSSGKMAQNLALSAYLRGANVTLLASKFFPYPLLFNLPLSTQIQIQHLNSAKDFQNALQEWITQRKTTTKVPYLFMAAAISDYSPKDIQKGKLKKENLGQNWQLEFTQNTDILASIDKTRLHTIGFKLEESQNALIRAKKALQTKKIDAICLNTLESSPFGNDSSQIHFITHYFEESLQGSKLEISLNILKYSALLENNHD